jgi:hypothetical protein
MAISFPLPVRREGLALLASGGGGVKVEPLSTTANKRGLLKLILFSVGDAIGRAIKGVCSVFLP